MSRKRRTVKLPGRYDDFILDSVPVRQVEVSQTDPNNSWADEVGQEAESVAERFVADGLNQSVSSSFGSAYWKLQIQ